MNYSSHTRTHISHRAHTQLLSATEGSVTSLYFIIISLGIFLGCKEYQVVLDPSNYQLLLLPPSHFLLSAPCPSCSHSLSISILYQPVFKCSSPSLLCCLLLSSAPHEWGASQVYAQRETRRKANSEESLEDNFARCLQVINMVKYLPEISPHPAAASLKGIKGFSSA